jgi:hypothetical protein
MKSRTIDGLLSIAGLTLLIAVAFVGLALMPSW